MENENLYKELHYINSIRQELQIIKNVIFDGNEFSKTQSDNLSKANLIKAMDYLGKEKDHLPRYYRKQIEFLLIEVRYKLSHE